MPPMIVTVREQKKVKRQIPLSHDVAYSSSKLTLKKKLEILQPHFHSKILNVPNSKQLRISLFSSTVLKTIILNSDSADKQQ